MTLDERRARRREYVRRWHAANPERGRNYRRQRYATLAPEEKANRLRQMNAYRARIRREILDHYGARCACCGETTDAFLTIDHINNDGRLHRRRHSGGAFYSAIIRLGFPKDLQILCWNCNLAKALYGSCPHDAQ